MVCQCRFDLLRVNNLPHGGKIDTQAYAVFGEDFLTVDFHVLQTAIQLGCFDGVVELPPNVRTCRQHFVLFAVNFKKTSVAFGDDGDSHCVESRRPQDGVFGSQQLACQGFRQLEIGADVDLANFDAALTLPARATLRGRLDVFQHIVLVQQTDFLFARFPAMDVRGEFVGVQVGKTDDIIRHKGLRTASDGELLYAVLVFPAVKGVDTRRQDLRELFVFEQQPAMCFWNNNFGFE